MENKENTIPIILEEIQSIFSEISSGSKDALNVDLYPIFQKFKRAIKPDNLEDSSTAFGKLCSIIETKFNELQRFLALFGQQKKFLSYLESGPSEIEIFELFQGCWYNTFNLNALSVDFLEKSNESLVGRKRLEYSIESVNIPEKDQVMILEIPTGTFQEKIEEYFKEIQGKLPCNINQIFEESDTQDDIYEKFVYILHLIQRGQILYQKQTNFLYKPKGVINE